MKSEVAVEYRQNRQGRVEKIVEAYANEHGLGNAKQMLEAWIAEGLDTYAIAEELNSTHQGVSYLCKKYGLKLGGRSQMASMLARLKKKRIPSLAAYFDGVGEKTIKEQAKELGVSETTVKRHLRAHRKAGGNGTRRGS